MYGSPKKALRLKSFGKIKRLYNAFEFKINTNLKHSYFYSEIKEVHVKFSQEPVQQENKYDLQSELPPVRWK